MPESTRANAPSQLPERKIHRRRLDRWIAGLVGAANIDVAGWRAFLRSMAALALAFVLAMYSTVFAQQGRIIATGICASLALALAGYVAFTAVPFLARRTRIEWMQVSLDYRVTREGWAFIVLILLLAIAGLNTGNNLLYLILASLLAAILMSGVLSLATLNGVDIDIELPRHVFARQSTEAVVRLANLKKVFPSFSLTLRGSDRQVGAEKGPKAHKPLALNWRRVLSRGLRLGAIASALAVPVLLGIWKLMADLSGYNTLNLVAISLVIMGISLISGVAALAISERRKMGMARSRSAGHSTRDGSPAGSKKYPSEHRGIIDEPLYFPFLPAARAVRRRIELEFPHRGHFRDSSFDLITRFPFGFLEKTMHIGLSRDLLVYPAVTPTDKFFEILPMLTGELESFQKGMGHDLYSIREMLDSDSVRHVDWKASARSGSMKVREYARENDRRVQLVLDNRVGGIGVRSDAPLQAEASASPLSTEALVQFESAVEFCACLAWHFHEMDAELQFVCGTFYTEVARASSNIYEILRFLAEVRPSPEAPDSPPMLSGEENIFRIVCTGMKKSSLPASGWNHSYLVFFDSLPGVPANV